MGCSYTQVDLTVFYLWIVSSQVSASKPATDSSINSSLRDDMKRDSFNWWSDFNLYLYLLRLVRLTHLIIECSHKKLYRTGCVGSTGFVNKSKWTCVESTTLPSQDQENKILQCNYYLLGCFVTGEVILSYSSQVIFLSSIF